MNGLCAALEGLNILCQFKSSCLPFYHGKSPRISHTKSYKCVHCLLSVLCSYLRSSGIKQDLVLGTTERIVAVLPTRYVEVSMYIRTCRSHLIALSQPLKWNKLLGKSSQRLLLRFSWSISGYCTWYLPFLVLETGGNPSISTSIRFSTSWRRKKGKERGVAAVLQFDSSLELLLISTLSSKRNLRPLGAHAEQRFKLPQTKMLHIQTFSFLLWPTSFIHS